MHPDITGFEDKGGPLLWRANVVLVFWGKTWKQNTALALQTCDGVQKILAGPYMFKLRQYRGIGDAHFVQAVFADWSEPPSQYNVIDVEGFLQWLLLTGKAPTPKDIHQAAYFVFMPEGTEPAGPVNLGGFHFSVETLGFPRASGACIRFFSDVDELTSTFSHELVELCTNPFDVVGGMAAIHVFSPKILPEDEIADVCRFAERVNNVSVSGYWSQADFDCVAPKTRSILWYLGIAGFSARPASLRAIANARGTNSLLTLLAMPLVNAEFPWGDI